MVLHDVYICDEDYVVDELHAGHGGVHDEALAGILPLVSYL